MKHKLHFFLTIAITFCCICSHAQSVVGNYFWNNSVLIEECKETGDSLEFPKFQIAISGQKFRVLYTKGSYAIIQILDYTEKNTDRDNRIKKYSAKPNFFKFNFSGNDNDYKNLPPEYANSRDYGRYQKYFRVTIAQLNEFATRNDKVGLSLAVGAINFPFKYRPQQRSGDFSGAFNFGAGLGLSSTNKCNTLG